MKSLFYPARCIGIPLLFFLFLFLILRTSSGYTSTHGDNSKSINGISFDKFPLREKTPVSFDLSDLYSEDVTEREQADQIKDWLVFTVLSNIGLQTEDMNLITYDIPIRRYEYMSEITNMEYGETRSKYLGDKKILAIIPKCTEKERQDYLAQIADHHRTNLDIIPEIIYAFEYEIGIDQKTASLMRSKNIDARKFFTTSSGYYEKEIKRLFDLEKFLSKIDAITYAEILDNGNLKVAGRKLQSRNYGAISLENIAALYQSESLNIIDGPGFSLDPTYDFDDIIQLINEHSFIFSGITPSVSSIIEQLKSQNIDPLFMAFGAIMQNYPDRAELANVILEDITANHEFQKARYDGDLKGTELGMNLFYTDLLAKLWSINFNFSAPKLNIDDFICDPDVLISRVFDKENEELNSTRLWFGPKKNNLQLSNDRKKMLFNRCATKIFAASSNQLDPGKESPVSAFWGTALNWWNNHYEEIAQFEQQYEKLNENMKWSLIISWLSKEDHLNSLSFLSTISVNKNHWFPNWAMSQKDLKFQEWDKIRFYDKGFLGNDTEVLPKLKSPIGFSGSQIKGGVSLGSKSEIASIGSIPKVSKFNGVLNRASSTLDDLTGEIITVKGNSYKISENEIIYKAVETANLQTKNGRTENNIFTRNISKTDNTTNISIRHGNNNLAMLDIAPTKNGFKVGMTSRSLDNAYSIALQLSDAQSSLEYLMQSNKVDNFLIRKENSFASRITEVYFLPKNSNQWVKVEIGIASNSESSMAHNLVVAGKKVESKICGVTLIDQNSIDKIIAQKGLSLYRPRGDVPSVIDWKNMEKYEVNLRKITELIRKKEYGIANEGLSQMIKFSDKPNNQLLLKRIDVALKEGSFLMKNGNEFEGIKIFNNLVKEVTPSTTNSENFYKTISELNRRQYISVEDSKILQQFIRYHYSESISTISNVNLKNVIGKGTQVRKEKLLESIKKDKGIIYIQDHPTLNNLDWSVSLEKSINTVIEKYPDAIIEVIPSKALSKNKVELRLSQSPYIDIEPETKLNVRLIIHNESFYKYDTSKESKISTPIDSTSLGEHTSNLGKDIFYIYLPTHHFTLDELFNDLLSPIDSFYFRY